MDSNEIKLARDYVVRYATHNGYMKQSDSIPQRPGLYVKEHIIPEELTVTAAADLLGVGRPALSNFLNGNAELSAEMASRLERAFGVDRQKLLQMQADFDSYHAARRDQEMSVGAYVPSFLKITARDIDEWGEGNRGARSLLPVLLRKLIHSTGRELSLVDFPGYDAAERKGWDGALEAGSATPWIPNGRSGWEFSCEKKPKGKADDDYAARVAAISAQERANMTFVFVTPRRWDGKERWVKEKVALAEWKSVRVFDASDLEQWLEQSISAQGWLAERMGRPTEGAHSLDEQWCEWASVTDPELSPDLFQSSVEQHKSTLKSWFESSPSSPLIIAADSKGEALAFLYCALSSQHFAAAGFKDRVVVFSSGQTLKKLLSPASSFIPVLLTDEVQRGAGGIHKKLHTVLIRPRNTVEITPDITLGLLSHEAFAKALAAMSIDDYNDIHVLARECGHSPTILRRRLSRNPCIKTPEWCRRDEAVTALIPMMLVGAWHTRSKADCEVLSLLARAPYEEVESRIATLLTLEDPPVWAAGQFRGVSSKIDAFFAVQSAVTQKHIDDFILAAEIVLSESDPALELPEEQRVFAGIYGKTREHSGAVREGICETLVLLAVNGNALFQERLGFDIGGRVNDLIHRLLTPLTAEKLLSQTGDLPLYAEAAPEVFLRVFEEDLKSPDPQALSLMKPVNSDIFGASCPRTGLLWALENLAWAPERLFRVCQILAKLAQRKIEDNWANKPEASLAAIFRSWMPQTAAAVDEREKVLQTLAKSFPDIVRRICVDQLEIGGRIGMPSHRPRWRNDASGAGRPVSEREMYKFWRTALDMAIAWPEHNETTLGDLVTHLQGLPEGDQIKVWDQIDQWAMKEKNDDRKAILRERIRQFAFTRPSTSRGLAKRIRNRARDAYEKLASSDPVVHHQWLFAKHWVRESCEELEDDGFDFKTREERIQQLRIAALKEIWQARGFEGIKSLLTTSEAAWVVGWGIADGMIVSSNASSFLSNCLALDRAVFGNKIDQIVGGFLHRYNQAARLSVAASMIETLSPVEANRILVCLPFERATWLLVDSQIAEVREGYWREMQPGWMSPESTEVNEAIDRLLEAKRPRAAFHVAHFAFKQVETSRLKRLLNEMATCSAEPVGVYQLDPHHISEAFDELQRRAGVTEEEMAVFEFQYIDALEHTRHALPNIDRQLSKSPSLFVQAVAACFKPRDGGHDLPEWNFGTEEQRNMLARSAYTLLTNAKRMPGTNNDGTISSVDLRTWIRTARDLLQKVGRSITGEQMIGQLLAKSPPDPDGVWPCASVREALEDAASTDIARGMEMGVYNSRGAHWRGEGGDQERALADKYRNWSRHFQFESPYVADVLEQIASSYDRDAAREDAEEAARKRLHR
jgi:addiction module HigA family antidote